MRGWIIGALFAVSVGLGTAGTARAQVAPQAPDALVADEQVAPVAEEGLDWKAGFSLGLSFNDNRNVIGQPDGYAFNVNGQIPVDLDYRNGDHQLRFRFEAAVGYSRTVSLPEFVKSNDMLKANVEYLFHVLEWLGPYARFGFNTSMIDGYDVRAGETTWSIAHLDGTTEDVTGTRLLLTEPFQPITFHESVGMFGQPYASDPFSIELRAGFGGLHTLADNQLVVTDDGATASVETKELQSFNQAVVEFGLAFWGDFAEKRVTYRVAAEASVPVVNEPENSDLSLGELTNVDLSASLSFKIFSWMSLDYNFKAIRQPQLLDEWQIQNNLLLTLSYSWSSADEEAAAADAAAAAE